MTLQHRFVQFIPEQIEAGILYISLEYHTVIHKCVCGCGNDVVTPISPNGWRFRFDGKTVSLHPSIGNGTLPCKSHYWIKNSKVVMADKMDNTNGSAVTIKKVKSKIKAVAKKNKY